MNTINQERFEFAKEKIIGKERLRQQIGTLSEKTIHAVVKNYYEPNEDYQEIPIEGLYADIFTGSEIIEIQTRSFDQLRKKLDRFLPLYPVTVVLPIPDTKWIFWINEETGELSEKRKSPKKGNPYQAFLELYKIKPYLKKEGLTITFLFMDMEEYKLLNGWSKDKKRGSERYDRIPLQLTKEYSFSEPKDYMQLLPDDLPKQFTSKELAKILKINPRYCNVFLNIIFDLGIVARVSKKGNSFIYEVVEY